MNTKKIILTMLIGLAAAAAEIGAQDSTDGITGRSDLAQLVSVSSSAELVETQFGGNYLYPPANVVDGKGETTWAPGGRGIGQTLSMSFAYAISYDEIQIVNGFAGANDLYNKNNRIKTIQISHLAGTSHFQNAEYELQDKSPTWQSIKFAQPQLAQSVNFGIKDVFRGNKYDDTCLSDIRFLLNGKVIPYGGAEQLISAQTKTSKEMLGKNSAQDFKKSFMKVPLLAADGRAYFFTDTKVFSGEYITKTNVFVVDYPGIEEPFKLSNNRINITVQVGYVETTQSLIFVPNGSEGITINGVYYKRIVPSSEVDFEI